MPKKEGFVFGTPIDKARESNLPWFAPVAQQCCDSRLRNRCQAALHQANGRLRKVMALSAAFANAAFATAPYHSRFPPFGHQGHAIASVSRRRRWEDKRDKEAQARPS